MPVQLGLSKYDKTETGVKCQSFRWLDFILHVHNNFMLHVHNKSVYYELFLR
jgi:hypothetical protein